MASNTDNYNDMIDGMDPAGNSSERIRRMKRLMRQMYRDEFNTKNSRLPPIRAKGLIVFFSFISIILFGVTTLYNFNLFVNLEENILAASSLVEDAMQRRTDLYDNLINLTLNQSALEQEVFRHVADVRADLAKSKNKPTENSPPPTVVEQKVDIEAGTPPTSETLPNSEAPVTPPVLPKNLNELPPMSRLLAVVEQYPNITSSVTYQQLMDKLVEIETRISKRRDEYNIEVRIYNTLITSFPWYILARITGFKRYDYFAVNDYAQQPKLHVPVLNNDTFKRLLPLEGVTTKPSSAPPAQPKKDSLKTSDSGNKSP
ncbi:MAG: LemA family protein [Magnetococcus sp. DMHC-6]